MHLYLSSLVHSNSNQQAQGASARQGKVFSPSKALLLAVGAVALGALALGVTSFFNDGASALLEHSATYGGIAVGAGFVVVVGVGISLHIKRYKSPENDEMAGQPHGGQANGISEARRAIINQLKEPISNYFGGNELDYEISFDYQHNRGEQYVTKDLPQWVETTLTSQEALAASELPEIAKLLADSFPVYLDPNCKNPEGLKNQVRKVVKNTILEYGKRAISRYLECDK